MEQNAKEKIMCQKAYEEQGRSGNVFFLAMNGKIYAMQLIMRAMRDILKLSLVESTQSKNLTTQSDYLSLPQDIIYRRAL